MEEAELGLFSVSENLTRDFRPDSNCTNSKDATGRICTQCQKWRIWDEFHRKKERFASKCKLCIRIRKKLFRKKKRKRKTVMIEKDKKFKCFIHGTLTPAMISDISQFFAYAMRVTQD